MLLSIALIAAAIAAPSSSRVEAGLSHHIAALPQPAARVQLVVEPAEASRARAVGDSIAAALPGAWIELVAGGLVQLSLPADQVDALAALPGLRKVRLPRYAQAKELTEGYDAMFDTDWHNLGLTGQGVRVAIIDVGFYGYQSLLGSELPASVETYFVGDYSVTEHGTAVAEIIHDIAPDAQLAFYSFSTEVEFYEACQQALDNGEYLVNASIGWDNVWHLDDTSSLTQAVNLLADNGVIWMAAAGNEAHKYWVGTVTDSDGNGWLEMDGSELLSIYAYQGYALASLRWDEPFGGAGTDIDLYMTDTDLETCGTSDNAQDGDDDPYEETWCHTSAEEMYIALYDYSGAASGTKIWAFSTWEMPESQVTLTETLSLPADASKAIAVGAVQWWDEVIAYYSSRGPTNDGRLKPDISAPTEVSTASYGQHGFNGTSAATPHATAVVALLLEATGFSYDREDVRDWLQANVKDLGSSGWDNHYGAGYLQLGAPPEADADTDSDADSDSDSDSDADTDTGWYWDSGGDDNGGGKGGRSGGCGCSGGAAGAGGLALMLGLLGLGWRRRR
jgi:MYXO-CTERM domain-containing protein